MHIDIPPSKRKVICRHFFSILNHRHINNLFLNRIILQNSQQINKDLINKDLINLKMKKNIKNDQTNHEMKNT